MLQNLFSFKISLGLLFDKAPIFLSRSKCLSMKLTLKRSVFIGIVKALANLSKALRNTLNLPKLRH